jgi:S1-C subfamily serine protease
MPKILLFRVAHDLSASLVSDLSRAGYDVATLETADVSIVLQQQPDLILLQTDVRTLDCCGLLTQLKGNEATAPVKMFDASGKVIGVNFAVLSDFSGSNFAVPISRAARMLEASRRHVDANLGQPHSAQLNQRS